MTYITLGLDEFTLGCIGTDVVVVCFGLDFPPFTILGSVRHQLFVELKFIWKVK